MISASPQIPSGILIVLSKKNEWKTAEEAVQCATGLNQMQVISEKRHCLKHLGIWSCSFKNIP